MSRIHLTGYILDAWEADDRSIFIAFKPNESNENVIPNLTTLQNTHKEITLSIDGQLPIKIVDLMGKELEKVD